jgi:hypothetical protein
MAFCFCRTASSKLGVNLVVKLVVKLVVSFSAADFRSDAFAVMAFFVCTYVSIRQHTSAYVSLRQHTSAYIIIRQHTSA